MTALIVVLIAGYLLICLLSKILGVPAKKEQKPVALEETNIALLEAAFKPTTESRVENLKKRIAALPPYIEYKVVWPK